MNSDSTHHTTTLPALLRDLRDETTTRRRR